MDDSTKESILQHIDGQELAELTRDLVDILSPTGSEKEIGEFILDWYGRNGLKPIRQEIDPNRVNAVGVLQGTGTRHLLTYGVQSDSAIVADRSALSIVWTQAGVAQFKIDTFGNPHAAWGVTREQEPPEEHNAVLKMARVAQAVDAWAEEFEANHVYQSANGPIIPKVNLGAVQGGAPYRPNYHPGICSLYVDVRIPPELRPIEVQRQLRAVMDATGYEYDIEMYTSKMGYEAKGIEPVVEVIEGTHQELFGEKTTPANTFRSSIWTDTNIYNEMGIPACKFGLGGGRFTTRSEQIDIDEIVRASQIYALSAATICNWSR